jgi:hypothetical protein
VAEFVQGYLTTQAGDQLVTEANDGNEPLVTQVQPAEDYNGYALETEAYTAAPGYDPAGYAALVGRWWAYLVKRTLELDGQDWCVWHPHHLAAAWHDRENPRPGV